MLRLVRKWDRKSADLTFPCHQCDTVILTPLQEYDTFDSERQKTSKKMQRKLKMNLTV